MKISYLTDNKIIQEDFFGEFDFECDLVVAGMGTAGAFCAVTAIELGLSVIGIDKCSQVGGTGTCGAVQDYYYGILSDSTNKINNQSAKDKVFVKSVLKTNEVSVSSSSKSFYLEKSMKNIKKLFLCSYVTAVFIEKDRVCGVQIFSDSRLINIKAKTIVDNTDGFVSLLSGCEFNSSRKRTMRCSKTLCSLSEKGVFGEWNSVGYIDGLNPYDLSKKMLEYETKPPFLVNDYFTSNKRVFEGELLGKREVPTVKCELVISFEDIIHFKDYKDTVFYGFAPFDNVNEELENETDNLQNWIMLAYLRHYGLSFAISMRSLIPVNRKGLLVTGKAFGTTHDVASMIRMKAEMEKCGETAGVMAFLSNKHNIELGDLNVAELQDILKERGTLNKIDLGLFNLRKSDNGKRLKQNISFDKAGLKKILSSKKPQLAFAAVLFFPDKNIKGIFILSLKAIVLNWGIIQRLLLEFWVIKLA